MEAKNAYEELMALNAILVSNFYSRAFHRVNGYALGPYWNQGVLMGDIEYVYGWKKVFDNIGKCQAKSFYESMTVEKFISIQNFSNIGWPNELANRMTSRVNAICQYPAAEVRLLFDYAITIS